MTSLMFAGSPRSGDLALTATSSPNSGDTPRDVEIALMRELFPFFFAVGKDGRITSVGGRWRDFAPQIAPGVRYEEVFAIDRPVGITGVEDLRERCNDIFLIQLVARPDFQLRGQFIRSTSDADSGELLFAGGPWITNLASMSKLGLEIRDFPAHDPRGDLLILLQSQESSLADQRQLSARLREQMKQQADLESQLRQIQKMELVGRFAGGMAHNFNNILMAIHGYAELALASAEPGDAMHEWLEQIRSATDHAASITRALLTMSRRHPVKVGPLSLAREFVEIENLLQPLLGEHVRILTRVDPKLGPIIADNNAIKQVVMNLVVNARDAMPEGGTVTIEVGATRRKPPDKADERDYIEIKVADNGVGMDDKTKSSIFEPFFTTKEIGKGIGLGLSTVYGLVQQAGGFITVESELGKGSTFRVFVPRVDAPRETNAAPKPKLESGAGEPVLLVEDDPQVRRLLEQLLKNAGYTTTCAASGDGALELLKSGINCNLLVTDVVMPGMSGPELAAQFEKLRGPVPVLFISGHTEDASVRGGRLPEHKRFLQKPFAPTELLKTVRQLLG